jgi:hypothetical protein
VEGVFGRDVLLAQAKDFATHPAHGLAVAGTFRAIGALIGDRR